MVDDGPELCNGEQKAAAGKEEAMVDDVAAAGAEAPAAASAIDVEAVRRERLRAYCSVIDCPCFSRPKETDISVCPHFAEIATSRPAANALAAKTVHP